MSLLSRDQIHVNFEHHNDSHRAELPLKDGMGGPVLWGWVAQPGNPISKVVLVDHTVIIFFNIMKYHDDPNNNLMDEVAGHD